MLVKFLIIFTATTLPNLAYDIFEPQPKIISKNGHLLFMAGEHKNITFHTEGEGRVHINGIDMTQSAKFSDEMMQSMTSYKTTFKDSLDKVAKLEQLLDDHDVLRKLRQLRGNANSTSYYDNHSSLRRIRALTRIIDNVDNELQDVKRKLVKDDCVSNPCRNGGTCIDLYDSVLCLCPKEWEGPYCDRDVNECAKFAGTDLGCQNGASCINRPGTYECVCVNSWHGLHCTKKTNDCNSASSTELCGHGICINQNSVGGYKCICDQGWTTDGNTPHCNTDINECARDIKPPCSVNPKVTCLNLPGSFTCLNCPSGYTGNGFYCNDIDECSVDNGGCSKTPLVQCINTLGSRVCGSCPPGYVGDGVSCSFQGVCNVDNGGCHPLATCTQNPVISSSFVQCICPAGYIGNGIGPNGCTPRPHTGSCSPDPCVHGTCSISNLTGSYVCTCPFSYTGPNCSILKNLCSINPCKNGGTCRSIAGFFYRCSCPISFTGPTCEEEKSICGGRLRQESGTLEYPSGSIETYNHRVSCAWVIETNVSKVLMINFTRFNIENSRDCQYDWLQIHDGRNTLAKSMGRFCGNALPHNGLIISTHNVLYLWFRSDHTVAKSGFALTWNSIDPVCGNTTTIYTHGVLNSPGSPGNYPNNRDCYWKLSANVTTKRIMFQFFSLMIGNNADCQRDYLEFIEGLRPHDKVFAKFCNSSQLEPITSPSSEVLVHFHSDSSLNYPGFQITYSLVEGIPGCGGVFTDSKGDIRSPTYNGKYQSNLFCEYKIIMKENDGIKLKFKSFDIEQSDTCRFDYVAIYQGPTTDYPLIGKYCGTVLPEIETLKVKALLIVFATDWTAARDGFVLQYETICGDVFNEPSGTIKSPGFPNIVNGPQMCIYLIEQPLGTVISFNFTDIKMELHGLPKCTYDYVQIRDGDNENSTLLGNYCVKAGDPILSTSNYLWIKFQTDQTVASKGFSATYTTRQLGCGGILKKSIGTFSTPQYPNIYSPDTLCTWILSAPPGYIVQITWMSFALEASYACTYDYVQIFDNATDSSTPGNLGKYCGGTKPPVLTSTSNKVTVFFKSDASVFAGGILASYTFLKDTNMCGGSFYSSAGIIKTPGYPNDYPSAIECVWSIQVEQGHQIMLNITDFSLETYSPCYDYLEIHNGGTVSSPLIGKYCGTSIPKMIPSHTNKLYLVFKSDLTQSSKGFKILWDAASTGCGGTLNAPTGSIISPNYPESYGTNTECIWKISVNAGSRVQALFSDIDLEATSECLNDYIEFYDGLTTNSKSIGRFCSNSQHISYVESTSNNLLVKFESDYGQEGRGFQINYHTLCNNTIKGFRGSIESPNFPSEYPASLNCVWDIIVSDQNKINISFSSFDLEGVWYSFNSSKCENDYVQIEYESETSEFVKYGLYCGTDLPPLITLNSHHARIRFITDESLSTPGFRLEWAIEGCGGLLTHPSGSIISPNYPHSYPPSIKCEWKIMVDFGKSIQITFSNVDIEKDSMCQYDSIKIYNGEDEEHHKLATFCHQNKPVVVTSTGNFMYLVFTADSTYQGRGFIGNYTSVSTTCGGKYTSQSGRIISPNYPKNYEKNDSCAWLIEIDPSFVISLSFEDVDLSGSDVDANCTNKNNTHIRVFDGPSSSYPVLATICGKNKPNNTIISSMNQMYVELITDDSMTSKGFSANYMKACGSKIVTESSGDIVLSTNDLPNNDQLVFDTVQIINTCNWTIISKDPTKHVKLTITQLTTMYMDCTMDKSVKVYDGQTTTAPLLGGFCGNKIPPTITSEGSALHIVLSTLDIRFFATYSVFDSTCGGSLNSLEGSFASPGFPHKYPVNTQCEWTLNVADGNHVSLTFNNFELLESENCNVDYLEIRKFNSSGPLIGVFCDKNIPENITHTGSLWLFLRTSNQTGRVMTAKGFYAEYSIDHDNELSGSWGIISSPLYPLSILTYEKFTWKITVNFGHKILITFRDFYVEEYGDGECYFTKIDIYDGFDSTGKGLASLCGSIPPKPIKSTSNNIFIQMEISSSRFATRFSIEWQEIESTLAPTLPRSANNSCNSKNPIDIHDQRNYTVIKSPGFPDGYGPNILCEWIITTIPMNHIKILMQTIDLDKVYSYGCFDYIEIFQKHYDDVDWQSINKICNDNFTYYISGTNLMKVVFKTNSYGNGTGFSAKILEDCGGYLTDPAGFISFNNSTKQPGSMYWGGFSECQWNVTVRAGKTIEVEFEEFNIEHDISEGCTNYVMLKNGRSSDSPFLGDGKYCGNILPSKLETTGNSLYVKFKGKFTNGFKLKYTEKSYECGGEILLTNYDNSSTISTPNYPSVPPHHIECLWYIRAPPGESLRVDFLERFDLITKKGCTDEGVEIRDGGTIYSSLIGTFCSNIPGTQYTTDNHVHIRYFTNVNDPNNGFKAKISIAKCGGTYREKTGVIEFPPKYTKESIWKNRNCTWNIIVPLHSIQIDVLKMNIGESNLTISQKYSYNNEYNVIAVLSEKNTSSISNLISSEAKLLLQVSQENSADISFLVKYNATIQECGGTLRGEAGSFTTPGYPNQESSRTCKWIIEVPKGRRVKLEILDLDVRETKSEGLVVFNGAYLKYSKSLIAMLSYTSMQNTIESSENYMKLMYWSTGSYNRRGLSAKFSSNQPAICGGELGESGVLKEPPKYNSSYYCTYSKIIDSIRMVDMTFSLTIQTNLNPRIPTNDCVFADSYIFVTTDNEKERISEICRNTKKSVTVRSPFPITKILIAQGYNKQNYTITYKENECGGIINGETGTISSPGYPNKYSKSVECSWRLSLPKEHRIKIIFKNMNLGNDCEKSYVDIYNGELPSKPKIGRFCQNNIPEIIQSQTNILWIDYKYDIDSDGKGFTLQYSPIIDGCGGTFHDHSRLIQTPSFPNEYSNNAECVWEIRSDEGYYIHLQFLDRFQIEESNNCEKDYLESWDWQNNTWISQGRKCGRNIPNGIKSTSNKLKLLFRSNDRITGQGFKAKWAWECGGSFIADKKERFIVSPGFPGSYQKNLVCFYNITSRLQYINIHFYDFNLEFGSNNCQYDNLTISNNIIHLSNRLASRFYNRFKNVYCGQNQPPDTRLFSSIYLKFSSDHVIQKSGFKFSYYLDSENCVVLNRDINIDPSIDCGDSITTPSWIKSPSLNKVSRMGVFHGITECVWNFTAPANKIVVLQFESFDLPPRYRCTYENLVIFDTLVQTHTNRLYRLCGNLNNNLPSIKSKGNTMSIKLRVDRTSNYDGFSAYAYFIDACDSQVNLTTPKTINFDGRNLSNTECVISITAPAQHYVKFEFQELKLPTSCGSRNESTFIEIRDGLLVNSELIENFCGITSNNVKEIVTSSQFASLRYHKMDSASSFKVVLTPYMSECGNGFLNVSDKIQVLTSPNYPNQYPENIRCSWMIKKTTGKFMIRFVEFNLTEESSEKFTKNKCEGDRLEIIDDGSIFGNGGYLDTIEGFRRTKTHFSNYDIFSGYHQFCGDSDKSFTYYPAGNSVKVNFITQSQSPKRGKGFKLEYHTIDCRNYTTLYGEFKFSSGAIRGCNFTIEVPTGFTISVYVMYSMNPSSLNCVNNGFEIREGSESGSKLIRYCGYMVPNPIFSTTNKLWIHAWNNRLDYHFSNFDLIYTSTNLSRGCGGTLYNYKGKFSSPLYPDQFTNSELCTWNVRVPIGMRAALGFKAFDIQGTCESNYVKVKTFSGDKVSTQKFCSDDNPATLYSDSHLVVEYQSSSDNKGTGWLAMFEAVHLV